MNEQRKQLPRKQLMNLQCYSIISQSIVEVLVIAEALSEPF